MRLLQCPCPTTWSRAPRRYRRDWIEYQYLMRFRNLNTRSPIEQLQIYYSSQHNNRATIQPSPWFMSESFHGCTTLRTTTSHTRTVERSLCVKKRVGSSSRVPKRGPTDLVNNNLAVPTPKNSYINRHCEIDPSLFQYLYYSTYIALWQKLRNPPMSIQ